MENNDHLTDSRFAMSPNPLVAALGDPMRRTREDIMRYIEENGIRMVNFMYPAADGRLKKIGRAHV